jgi:hypothetical protein
MTRSATPVPLLWRSVVLIASLSSCSSNATPADPHTEAVVELFDAMDMPAVHRVVVGHLIEEGRRDVGRDTSAAAVLAAYADGLAWDSVRDTFVVAFKAVLTAEDARALTRFLGTSLGNRLQTQLPSLFWVYVLNQPGAEGQAQLEQVLASFTAAERTEMDALLNGEGLTKLGVAAVAGYYTAMRHIATEIERARL